MNSDNPLFHIESVAVAALEKKYTGKEIPAVVPADFESAMISYSVAVSLKRIADSMEKISGKRFT